MIDVVENPILPRVLAKAVTLLKSADSRAASAETDTQLNVVTLGDSIMPAYAEILAGRLKAEYVNGGLAGRLAGEGGFLDDGNGTNCTHVTWGADPTAFAVSPIGLYWRLSAGGSKYWGVGASDIDQPMLGYHAASLKAPLNVTRLGVYYHRHVDGGTFALQIARGTTLTYYDVPSLAVIDTNGADGVHYAEASIPAWSAGTAYAIGEWVTYEAMLYRCGTATTAGQSPATAGASWLEMSSVWRIRTVHVSGGDCHVLGALVASARGVISHSWTAGGLPLTNLVNSPRFAELAALIPADMVCAAYLDDPGDGVPASLNNTMTRQQLHDGIMTGIRAAFPATAVNLSGSAYAGKTAPANRKPHFVWFGPHNVENALSDRSVDNAAMKANALNAGDCYVDVIGIFGAWRNAYDVGLMGYGDTPGSSTHQRRTFGAAVMTLFLQRTGLIGAAVMRPIADQTIDKLTVGTSPRGAVNRANRVAIGDAHIRASMGPGDHYSAVAYKAWSDVAASYLEAGYLFESAAPGGGTGWLGWSPGGGVSLRDLTANKQLLLHNGGILFLGNSPGMSVQLGPKGDPFTGLRSGTVTLVDGVATVTHAKLTANCRPHVTRIARGGTPGATYDVTRSAGAFTITSRTSADAVATADTSTVSWMTIEP
jgi:hypothetical protein